MKNDYFKIDTSKNCISDEFLEKTKRAIDFCVKNQPKYYTVIESIEDSEIKDFLLYINEFIGVFFQMQQYNDAFSVRRQEQLKKFIDLNSETQKFSLEAGSFLEDKINNIEKFLLEKFDDYKQCSNTSDKIDSIYDGLEKLRGRLNDK